MILYPAIDIQDGKAVRLKQGKKNEATVFSDDPLDMAKKWHDSGAEWLHIVDLDGAFAGYAKSVRLISRICDQVNVKIQIGGGIRNLETAETYLDAGADRIIIGTMALEEPHAFSSLCRNFPGKVGVSLDAHEGRIKTRGWEKDADRHVDEVLPELGAVGAAFVIYTDIERDGMRTGINMKALEKILRTTRLPVISSGGVSSLEDIKELYEKFRDTSLNGVISGRALYEGNLDFSQAAAWLRDMEESSSAPI